MSDTQNPSPPALDIDIEKLIANCKPIDEVLTPEQMLMLNPKALVKPKTND